MADAYDSKAWLKGYNSFAGIDMKCVIDGKLFGTLQAINYRIVREKAPVFTMHGSPNPLGYSRGKRAITGTMVMVMTDHHVLLDSIAAGKYFLADKYDIKMNRSPLANNIAPSYWQTSAVAPGGATVEGSITDRMSDPLGTQATMLTGDVFGDQIASEPWYVDQIPPFDILLSAANEYGHMMVMTILACEILDEGWGISVNDLASEHQFTYAARDMIPWQKVTPNQTVLNQTASGE